MKLLVFNLDDHAKVVTKGNAFTITTNEIVPIGYNNTTQEFLVKIEQEDINYQKSTAFAEVGNDNAPISQVSPTYSATAIKGWTAVWSSVDADVRAWAKENLLDFEIITNGTNSMVVGTLNQSLSDAYNPLEYPVGTALTNAVVFKEPYTAI